MIRIRDELRKHVTRTPEEAGERITDDSNYVPNAEKIRATLNGGRIEGATLLYDFDGQKRLSLENDITRIEGISRAEIHQYQMQIQEEYSENKRQLQKEIEELKAKKQEELNAKLRKQIEEEVMEKLASQK